MLYLFPSFSFPHLILAIKLWLSLVSLFFRYLGMSVILYYTYFPLYVALLNLLYCHAVFITMTIATITYIVHERTIWYNKTRIKHNVTIKNEMPTA